MLSRNHLMLRQPGLGREGGWTIIELMIVMLIMLVVLAAVSQSFLTGLFSQKLQAEQVRLQESSRFAFDLLSRSIRHAGYRNTYALLTGTSLPPGDFCNSSALGSQFASVNDPASIDPTSTTIAGSTVTIANESDVVRVRFYGEDNGQGTAADGSVIDCLGNSIRRGALVAETLYVAADPSNHNEPALFCHSTAVADNPVVVATGLPTNVALSPNPAPLIPGVESLQLLFGEDTDGDGSINRYVSPNNVSNPDNVVSVMVSMVVRTDNTVNKGLLDTPKHEFVQFGKTVTLPNDQRFRRLFTTTIAFRNFRQC